MRLGLGLLIASLVALAGCSESKNQCAGSFAFPSGSSIETFTADPPVTLDGNAKLTGDGEVKGSPQAYGSSSSPSGGSSGSGCDAVESADRSAEAPAMGSAPSGGASSSGSGSAMGGTGGEGGGGGGNGTIQPGVLTAGVWDDNKNFDRFLSYRSGVLAQKLPGLLSIDEGEHRAAHDALAALAGPKQKLDVSLVIDTTGSMGDEISYLQKEFDALASTIQAKFPGSEQRWSLVVYKDTTDEYVVRWFDFRADTKEFREKLAAQSASGGGDFPEASDQALNAATRLSWRADPSVAKLMFWVADAPHHDSVEKRMTAALRSARDQQIHVYPVASSGVDELTELSMRSAAQLTGGRYVFLTDDSGVGGTHKEASVPCFYVTKLDKAILRVVDIEMTGNYREPEAADVLRKGGDPKSGVCTLESGQQVTIY